MKEEHDRLSRMQQEIANRREAEYNSEYAKLLKVDFRELHEGLEVIKFESGVVAMLTNSLLLLPVIGVLFVVEAGSSAIQIFSKKVFKRKIFISAPIHHHLEAKGWEETKITMRFWIIAVVSACLGVLLAFMGGGAGGAV
jgi:hypothetical protein